LGIDWYECEDVVEAGINPNWLAFRVNRSERRLPFRDIRTELYTLHSIVSESSRHRLRERTDREERQALHSSIRTFFDAAFPPQPREVIASLDVLGFDPDAILSEDDLRTRRGSLCDGGKRRFNRARRSPADEEQALGDAYER